MPTPAARISTSEGEIDGHWRVITHPQVGSWTRVNFTEKHRLGCLRVAEDVVELVRQIVHAEPRLAFLIMVVSVAIDYGPAFTIVSPPNT